MGKENSAMWASLTGRDNSARAVGGYVAQSKKRNSGAFVQIIANAVISAVMLALVWLYGNSLRDARYFDGWVLAGGMGLQLYFHIALKSAHLSPKAAVRWRAFHIFLGYFLIVAFVSHCDFTLPDTAFEWALWASFVLITISGILATYLSWSLRSKRGLDGSITYDRIPARCAELAQEAHETVSRTEPQQTLLPLPLPPHDAWVADFYTTHLKAYFAKPHNAAAHMAGSNRALKVLTDEIDTLSGYVDKQTQEKLAILRSLVIEKDQLDFARAHLGLSRSILFIHVPVTYALIVLTVLHVLVAYSFSSGVW